MVTERDAYAILQVSPGADPDVIKRAYRALARLFHPDGQTPDSARMAEINRAYERLKTPEARRRYDAERSPGVPVGPGRATPHGPSAEPWAPVRMSGTERWAAARRRAALGADVPDQIIDFGRYAGWRIADLALVDPDYLRWLSRHSAGIRFRDAIARCLPGESDIGRRANILGG